MISLFHKKNLASCGVFKGMTDYHSHILPGVDDGVRKMETSLEILRFYEDLGIAEVWCTPHIMEDIPNRPENLKKRFEQLKAEYDGPIRLHLAAEHMLDGLFAERFSEKDILPIGEGGNHLLVETSYFTPPVNMDEMLSDIMAGGYFPVLAHPERYVYMENKDYKKYREMGVCFQLNLPSLTGAYGKIVKKKAEWMLKNGMYMMYGTDIHSFTSFKERIQSPISVDLTAKNEDQI